MLANGNDYFITSDTPLVRELAPDTANKFAGPGLANPDVQVTMPLSPKMCLLATWNENAPKHLDLESEGVAHCNIMRAVHATRALYGPHDDDIRELARKYAETGLKVRIGDSDPASFSPVSVRRGE
jgi:hypothetical protein